MDDLKADSDEREAALRRLQDHLREAEERSAALSHPVQEHGEVLEDAYESAYLRDGDHFSIRLMGSVPGGK